MGFWYQGKYQAGESPWTWESPEDREAMREASRASRIKAERLCPTCHEVSLSDQSIYSVGKHRARQGDSVTVCGADLSTAHEVFEVHYLPRQD